jgi:hypothetical protein
MKTNQPLQNQKGQMVVEGLLIIVLLFGLTLLVSKAFVDEELLAKVVSGPWKAVDGMIQNGTWAPADKSQAFHPNQSGIHITMDEE